MTDTFVPPAEPATAPPDQTTPSETEVARQPVAAPQAGWRVGLLVFATGGLYACFWMYGRGRDARALGGGTTPWLWFLAPLVSLAMPFALGKLRDAYAQALPAHPLSDRVVGLGWGIFVVNGALGLDSRFEFPLWVTLILLVVQAVIYGCVQHEIARVHRAAEDLAFRDRADTFSALQIAALMFVGLPLVTVLLVTTLNTSGGLWGERVSGVQPIAATGYGFTLPEKGWSRSDDSFLAVEDADAQYQGPLLDSWIEVYDYGRTLSLNDVMEYRRSDFTEMLSGAECSQHRRLAAGSTDVIATLRCTGRNVGDRAFAFAVGVATEHGVAEVVGEASGPLTRMGTMQRELEALVDSVGALP